MNFSVKIFLKIFISIAVFAVISCVRSDEFPVNQTYVTGAEILNKKGDRFLAENDTNLLFDGGRLRTGDVSFNGDYAVYTTSKKAFAFAFKINSAGPDWYFKLSVWRKSKNGKGVLVASSKDAKKFYAASSIPVEITDDGWEKLEMEVYTPPTFINDELTFYVWNNNSDTIYFDNFKIERRLKKIFPEFNEEPLSIILDSTKYLKIINKRKEAFKSGILQSSDNDWVKAIVFGNGKMMKANVRLKGDWLDHLRGEKWSFRIKMKKGFSWNGLRTFSIQTPLARGFMNEWVAHKFYDAEDILTTRYGYIPLSINNESKGLYAWEEHFEKQLLEWRNRREGPILKFTEEAFWQIQKYSLRIDEKWPAMPYYQATAIKPFKQSKTVKSPVLYKQFLNAQKLVQQYKDHSLKPSEIFDLDKLAKYYAMLDLTQARHGMVWHNQRFYFNPILCKLEPIAFDGYADYSNLKPGIENNYAYKALTNGDSLPPHDYLTSNLFTDSAFANKYLTYLKQFSKADFVIENLNKINDELYLYDSLIGLEFPNITFDVERYIDVAADIRSYLPALEQEVHKKQSDPEFELHCKRPSYSDSTIFEDTPKFFVNAYMEKVTEDSVLISIYNYFPGDIIILGTGSKSKYVDNFQHPEPKIKAYSGGALSNITIVSDTSAIYLFFMTPTGSESFFTEILPWPYPRGLTSQQELVLSADINDYSSFLNLDGNNLYIEKGSYVINYPVIIPEGYKFKIDAGTTIDLVDSAMIISYSPIEMIGTDSDKIKITSSDFSAKGFTVLQANVRSKLEHVIFENLNTLDYKGWTLTGAVNFYESDVDISNTLFYRNQCEDALNTIRSDFKLDQSTFSHIFGDAFDSDFCTGVVNKCSFTNIGNDAIDFSGSRIEIADTEIIEANDKGISGGENSYLTVINTSVIRSNIGMASKDLSTVVIINSSVTDCNYGIVLLQKKPEYGPAKMILENLTLTNLKVRQLIEVNSEAVIDGKIYKGDQKSLAEQFY